MGFTWKFQELKMADFVSAIIFLIPTVWGTVYTLDMDLKMAGLPHCEAPTQ